MLRAVEQGVWKKGVVTTSYPAEPYIPYDSFLGMPLVDCGKCISHGDCVKVCPTGAITLSPGKLEIDLGLCIFCGECARSCPEHAVAMSKEFELAAKTRAMEVRSYAVRQG